MLMYLTVLWSFLACFCLILWPSLSPLQ
jgi:hypothetical protein